MQPGSSTRSTSPAGPSLSAGARTEAPSCATASSTAGGQAAGAGTRAAVDDDAVERVRAQAEAGETEWAAILAIRALAAPSAAAGHAAREGLLRAALWNDLGVLRFGRGDTQTAVACLREALRLDPTSELAAANLADLEPLASEPTPSADAHMERGPGKASPWVREALREAVRCVGLEGRHVLEVGGAVPHELARASGAASWTACDPSISEAVRAPGYVVTPSDARALPFSDAHFDLVFSSCAFEHIHDLPRALSEIARVLRAGGHLFAQFAPIWSCAIGHHLFLESTTRGLISFNDPLLPAWAHLLLEPDELEVFLAVAIGAADARRAVASVTNGPYLNRLFAADYERCFERCGLERLLRQPWGTRSPLTPALERELLARHPQGGSFALPGMRIVMRRPG